MAGVGTVPAELVGLVLESLLTGTSLVFFATAIYVLLCKRGIYSTGSGEKNSFIKVIFWITVTLCISITMHWIASVARAFNAFVYEANDPGPLAVFENLADASNIIKTALYMFEVLLFDCVLLYRLFVVWNRRITVVILPCIAYIGLCTCCVALLHEYSELENGTPFTSSNVIWIDGCYSFSISINLYATPMIAYRIWSSTRRVAGLARQSSSLTRPIAFQLIIESGLIYGTVIFVSFVFYLAKTQIFQATLDITSPVIGIAFCLIIVRSNLDTSPNTGGSSQSAEVSRGIASNSNEHRISTTNKPDQPNSLGRDTSDDKVYPLQSLTEHVAGNMVTDVRSAFEKGKADRDNSVTPSSDPFKGEMSDPSEDENIY